MELIERIEKRKAYYRCNCGNVFIAYTYNIKSGHTKSCGCLRVSITRKRATSHGHKSGYKRTRVYAAWVNMKSRCTNRNRPDSVNYVLRGITVCPEWEIFEAFLSDMGEPMDGQTLDRIDNEKGYCKENCRWTGRKVQNSNKRSNVNYTFGDKTMNLAQWAKELGIGRATLYKRLQRGVGIDIAFTHKGYLKTNDATTGLLRIN